MSGPFGSSQWMYASGGFYNGIATQSLRFDDGSSAYLSRTPSSAGNRKTWTFSCWVKRGNLGEQSFLDAYSDDSNRLIISFSATNALNVFGRTGGSTVINLTTSQLFRDVSAWYHIVLKMDTTQATSTERVKIYVNGVQVSSFSGATYPTLNYDTFVNATVSHSISSNNDSGGREKYLDGYMAEVNFVDGTALDPTSFGETKNGVWIAKEYTGSYGTNGYRLQFNQTGTGTASSSTIGADTSGNDNHWTSSGIVASDCDMPDSPENNFATFNTLDKDADYTLSEGNLKADSTVSGYGATKSTFAVTSGKWYWEIRLTGTGVRSFIGIAKTTVNPINATNGTADTLFYQGQNGNIWYDGSDQGSYSSTYTTNDIISVALNLDDNEITFYKNGTSGGVAISSIEEGDWTPSIADGSTGYITSFVANFGQDPSFAGALTGGDIGTETPSQGAGVFKYTVPSGYKALCTANLPEPTISPNASTQADDYFNTATYSGNSSTQNITSVGFQPDWVWIKSRSNASNNYVTDVVRGTSKGLQTNISNAEVTNTNVITSFNSDGFSLGDDATANVANITGRTYVSWNWKAGGTAVSNTDGSITSSVSANTDAGFSIVSYTSNNSAGATVGHGLGVAPQMVIIKKRSASERWFVWHTGDSTEYMYLNETFAGQANLDDRFGNNTTVTLPSSTVLTLGTNNDVNGTSGSTYIAYCFAEIEGYSKFGSYTGNGSTDGTFVYTGFRPAFVLVKDTGVADWDIQDTTRSPFNPSVVRLWANLSSAEVTSTYDIDFLSNGFKLRSTNPDTNSNGDTKIYMAFADGQPFKYANAR